MAQWALLGLLVSATACGSASYSRGALWADDPDGGADTGTLIDPGSGGRSLGTGGRLASGGTSGTGGAGSTAGGSGGHGTGGGGTGSTGTGGGVAGGAGTGGAGTGGAGTGGAGTGGAGTGSSGSGGAGTGGAGTGNSGSGGAGTGGAGTGNSGSGGMVAGGSVDDAQYNFEASVQSWKAAAGSAPFTAIARGTAQSFAGNASLAGSVTAVASKTYILEVSPPTPAIPAGAAVTFHVFVPSTAMLGAVQPYVLETGSFRFTGTRTLPANIARDNWTTVVVTVPTGAAAILRMGVQFESTGAWTDTVYVDSVSW